MFATEIKKRHYLFKKHEGVEVELRTRDREIIRALYEYRFLTTQQLYRLFPEGNYHALTARLAKLYYAGYVERPISQIVSRLLEGERYLIYCIGERGFEVLQRAYGIAKRDSQWYYRRDTMRENYLTHTIGVNNFSIALKQSTLAHADEILSVGDWQGAGKTLLDSVADGSTRLSINPDGFYGWQFLKEKTPNKIYSFFEYDRGTMSLKRVARKYRAYWLYRGKAVKKKHEIERFLVLTVVTHESRRRDLLEVCQSTKISPHPAVMFWFALEREINYDEPRSILGKIWHTPDKDALSQSLLPEAVYQRLFPTEL
jgi:hypothetical protein